MEASVTGLKRTWRSNLIYGVHDWSVCIIAARPAERDRDRATSIDALDQTLSGISASFWNLDLEDAAKFLAEIREILPYLRLGSKKRSSCSKTRRRISCPPTLTRPRHIITVDTFAASSHNE